MRIYKSNGKYVELGQYIPDPVIIDNGEDGGIVNVLNTVVGEKPIGLINGINATFITQFSFIPESVEVFNGIKLSLIDDYITIGTNTIQLTSSPLAGEHIKVNYTKAI